MGIDSSTSFYYYRDKKYLEYAWHIVLHKGNLYYYLFKGANLRKQRATNTRYVMMQACIGVMGPQGSCLAQ